MQCRTFRGYITVSTTARNGTLSRPPPYILLGSYLRLGLPLRIPPKILYAFLIYFHARAHMFILDTEFDGRIL